VEVAAVQHPIQQAVHLPQVHPVVVEEVTHSEELEVLEVYRVEMEEPEALSRVGEVAEQVQLEETEIQVLVVLGELVLHKIIAVQQLFMGVVVEAVVLLEEQVVMVVALVPHKPQEQEQMEQMDEVGVAVEVLVQLVHKDQLQLEVLGVAV
jgi:hypothetical protein